MAFPWLYLTLGVAWLVAGLAMLTGLVSGPWSSITLGETPFSAGWLALALGLYNLVRWYHRRGLAQTRAWQKAQDLNRQKMLKNARQAGETETNPMT
jgi:hypothetical protein